MSLVRSAVTARRHRLAPPHGRADRFDAGSAVVEFVLLAVVLLVPFGYAVLTLFALERAAFAATAAAREGGRAYVTAAAGPLAADRAEAAVRLALTDDGLAATSMLSVACSADPCLTPGGRVRVDVATRVRLPLAPAWGTRSPASVVVRARHVEVVDEFTRARP